VVLVATLGGGHNGSSSSSTSSHSATTAHRSAASTGSRSTTTGSTSSAATAVEQFYEAAARHQYPAAWALADANLRNQLGGYSAFQNQMNSVRSITFHRAAAVAGSSASTATVELSTTSVQTGRTQECVGTARTVRSGGAWLLDGISISCS
jgi:hypothetical protein